MRWYGWQPLAADAAGYALAAPFLAEGVSPLLAGGFWYVGAPAIHWAHGNRIKAGVSLGLHVAPAAFWAGLESQREACEADTADDAPCFWLGAGAVVSFVVALMVDAFSYDDAEPAAAGGYAVLPWWTSSAAAGGAAVQGRF